MNLAQCITLANLAVILFNVVSTMLIRTIEMSTRTFIICDIVIWLGVAIPLAVMSFRAYEREQANRISDDPAESSK